MTKHEYIIEITKTVSKKSTCLKIQVGAVFVNEDYEILSTGYNGAPKGLTDCLAKGKCTQKLFCKVSAHAEQNAIVQAAKRGTALKDSILYITHAPCINCAKLLINLGCKKVIILKKYKSENGIKLLKLGGIKVEVI